MMTLTENETLILSALIASSDAGSIDSYEECLEEDECLTFVDLESLQCETGKNQKELGGTLSSLEKKGVVGFLDANVYGLGCNCWKVYQEGINYLREAA